MLAPIMENSLYDQPKDLPHATIFLFLMKNKSNEEIETSVYFFLQQDSLLGKVAYLHEGGEQMYINPLLKIILV